MTMTVLMVLGTLAVLVLGTVLLSALFRRVVPTNEVHIVQSTKKTTSYGKDTTSGNTYYELPSWLPLVGVNKTVLPVSVFDLDLTNYEAYDKGRLPFVVDVKAFFRITDSNMAAQRVASFKDLHGQLQAIVQGAVRTILASSEIEEIMQGRSKFGEEFTKEVSGQLSHWGVAPVKNIELMDLRDSNGSAVIHNIMEKKKSHIEMESRTEVAKNRRQAEISEIDAKRDVELQRQEALQAVGMRTAKSNQEVTLAQQTSEQTVKEQQKVTKEKEMAILAVEHVRKTEIANQVQLLQSQQAQKTTVIAAEANLEAKKRESEGIVLEGQARANSEKAMQLAPVEAQIVLAKEIGSNESYQNYLVTIKKVEAQQAVGMEQAKALEKADIKIISNSGDPVSGVDNVRDLFTSKGGTQIGAMLEGLGQTTAGKAVMNKIGLTTNGTGK